jgi:hypothetical protein
MAKQVREYEYCLKIISIIVKEAMVGNMAIKVTKFVKDSPYEYKVEN